MSGTLSLGWCIFPSSRNPYQFTKDGSGFFRMGSFPLIAIFGHRSAQARLLQSKERCCTKHAMIPYVTCLRSCRWHGTLAWRPLIQLVLLVRFNTNELSAGAAGGQGQLAFVLIRA